MICKMSQGLSHGEGRTGRRKEGRNREREAVMAKPDNQLV